jgi:putative transposase
LVDGGVDSPSIRRQCELLGLPRSSYYHEPAGESDENLKLMRLIDEHHLERPAEGRRQMTAWLRLRQHAVNPKRVRRLMRIMGLEAIYPKPKTTHRNPDHKVYPYLLGDIEITRPDQVWSTDITYVPMRRGFMYLVAVMDWYSRHVLSWEVSNSLETSFCIEALEQALSCGCPEIFNTDQGVQFTSKSFTSILESRGVRISMDGRGRALDNVFIERLWRTVKYEEVYLKEYETVADLIKGLTSFLGYYSKERPHEGLMGRTPLSVYRAEAAAKPIGPRRCQEPGTALS